MENDTNIVMEHLKRRAKRRLFCGCLVLLQV